MITIGIHFQVGYACEIETNDHPPPSNAYVITLKQGSTDINLFFPTATARDAVRDALLQCPGCVARAEETATPEAPDPPLSVIVTGGGSHAPTTTTVIAPQPAVQAMEGQEDWF